jgi:hypothetical protein
VRFEPRPHPLELDEMSTQIRWKALVIEGVETRSELRNGAR